MISFAKLGALRLGGKFPPKTLARVVPVHIILNFLLPNLQMALSARLVCFSRELSLHPLKADVGTVLELQGRGAECFRLKVHCKFARLPDGLDDVKVIKSRTITYRETGILYVRHGNLSGLWNCSSFRP